jgi:hypothetical protein
MGNKTLTWNEAMTFCGCTQGPFSWCMGMLRIMPATYEHHPGKRMTDKYSLSDIKCVKKYYEKNKQRWMPK